jgi:PAS domain S-box-containing protein
LSLRLRLLQLVLIAALPAMVLAGLLSWLTWRDQVETVKVHLGETTRAIALSVDGELGQGIALLRGLSTSTRLREGDLAAFHAQASGALPSGDYGVIVQSVETGQHLLNTHVPWGGELARFPARLPWIEECIASRAPVFKQASWAPKRGSWTYSVQLPVIVGDRVAYVIELAADTRALGRELEKHALPSSWVATVLDPKGISVSRTRDPELWIGKPPSETLQQVLRQISSGVSETTTLEGVRVLTAVARAPQSQYTVAIGVPMSEQTAPLWRYVAWVSTGSFAVALLGALLAWTLANRLSRPIRQLADAAAGLGQGEAVNLPPSGLSEVERVRAALLDTAGRLRRRTEERDRTEAELARLNAGLEERVAERTRALEKAVRRRRRSEERYSALFNNSAVAMYVIGVEDDGFVIEEANPFFFQTSGQDPAATIGHRPEETLAPEAAAAIIEKYRECVRIGERLEYEIEGPLPAGYRIRRVVLSPLKGADGRVKRIFASAFDITEARRVEEQLRQAQKMEAIGQLTGGVAHDFNNLLTAILGNLELLQAKKGLDPSTERPIRGAIRAAERGAKLAQQLLAFSRKQDLRVESTDLNEIVSGMGDLLGRTIGTTIGIERVLAGDLWRTLADPNQIELVLLNLAINARDAMPLGGKLSITTRNVRATEAQRWTELKPGDYVEVAVSDTGTGIAPENLQRVFEPFFTTKDIGKGSGLGLSMVLGVATQSGGTVRIDSKLGQGTTVRVLLPRDAAGSSAARAAELRPQEARAVEPRRGRILLVDDDNDVRDFSAECLKAIGCTVVEAESGIAAIELLQRDRSFDLAVVDFAMPGMNGVDFIAAARQLLPSLPALLVTGFADAGELKLDPATTLKKPFKMRELQERVASSLEKQRATGKLVHLPRRS